jgi:predicted O-methyltransferase YrrM
MSFLKELRRIRHQLQSLSGESRRSKQRQLEELVSRGLPVEFREGLDFLVTGKTDAVTAGMADRIEALRADIAASGQEPVPILYSPKPGTAGREVLPDMRPQPGEVLEFTMERIAITGRDRRWGTFLHLLAKATKATSVLELGACAGISGCYLATPESVVEFMTVEGSPTLANLASDNIRKVFPSGVVVSSLFDDAIDNDIPRLKQPIDYAFIDGHHESIATIHYYERLVPHLAPKAVVVFDDISWSADMNTAWEELSSRSEFSHAMDVGPIGVCLYDSLSANEPPQYWDLRPILGRPTIGDPHGWKKEVPDRREVPT